MNIIADYIKKVEKIVNKRCMLTILSDCSGTLFTEDNDLIFSFSSFEAMLENFEDYIN